MALIIHTLISNILKNPQCNFYTYVKHFLIWNIFIKSSAPLLTLILRLTLLWKHTDIYTKIINSNFQYVKHQKHLSVTYFSVFTLLVKKKNLSLRLDFHSSYWNAGFLVNFSSNRLNTRATVSQDAQVGNYANWCQPLPIGLGISYSFCISNAKKIKRIKWELLI